MGERTGIEWCHHTFNPWMGCVKVSAGCKHCYAERESERFGKHIWGVSAPRPVTSEAYWKKPLSWNKKAAAAGERRRVFCGSFCDVFEDRPDLVEPRARLFELIEATPHLDWLLLTKRPENIKRQIPLSWASLGYPANVWIGTSVEDQETADKRIPALLHVPCRVRFLSCEPLLGSVDLTRVHWARPANETVLVGDDSPRFFESLRGYFDNGRRTKIDWVIAGGESGPDARPMHPDHAYTLRDQCLAAGVPFFFKQWGEWVPRRELPDEFVELASTPTLTLADLADVFAPGYEMLRAGKKPAGRLLGRREWNEVPA